LGLVPGRLFGYNRQRETEVCPVRSAAAILENILTLHARRCPAMEVRDYVKLLYQSEFGPGHLMEDGPAALAALREEFAQAKAENYAPAYAVEAIGGGLCRFHLDPRRLTEEDLPLLCRCLVLSAGEQRGSSGGLERKLGVLSALAWKGGLPLDPKELELYLALYTAKDCPALHHSAAYREAYHPHYRVLDRDLGLYFPALRAIDKALRESDGPVLVCVDGRCASGKTTFAARCAQVFDDCSVLHMDDFFLPPDKRTPQRLAEPGGNVDYERAEEELFLPLSRGEAAAFRPFDCAKGDFGGPVGVPCRRLNLVEGSYSLHPALEKYAQVKIFFTCSPEVQLSRLSRRESPESLEKFQDRWVPMEETYFKAFSVEKKCGVVVDTSRLPTKEVF